jgi:hypothetical protein
MAPTRLLNLNEYLALKNFGLHTIPKGTPISELEKILVPVYLMHRYQIEAVSKLIGGLEYSYAVKGFGKVEPLKAVDTQKQDEALQALLQILTSEYLSLPIHITELIYPPADGYPLNNESFTTKSAPAFDVSSVQESGVIMIMDVLFQPQRLQRLENQGLLRSYLSQIVAHLLTDIANDKIKQIANIQFILRIKALMHQENVGHMVRMELDNSLNKYRYQLGMKQKSGTKSNDVLLHYLYNLINIKNEDIKNIKLPNPAVIPPGAPIGSCSMD